MGTTWEVTVRGGVKDPAALQSDIAARLEAIESELSSWRADSAVSRFNASRDRAPVAVPQRVATLAALAAGISEKTDGAFDITAGPLVKLWGFGPAPRKDTAPSAEEINEARSHAGWKRLHVTETHCRRTIRSRK